MAEPVSTTTSPYASTEAKLQQMQIDNAAFQAVVQSTSAQMQAAGTATNLITSAHSAASNNAKNVGQGMVETSRK